MRPPTLRRRLPLFLCLFATASAWAGPPPLERAGRRFVDAAGAPVTLRGCNLGNWLLLEPWMLGLQRDFRDQADILATLRQRFGPERAAELLDIYRTNWIGAREFEIVRRYGFNLVRVPFHYNVLADDEPPYALRPDAFRWLDRAVELAEQAGVYVILDMHGLPGGQSKDMTTGERDQNRLWTDESCIERTEQLWRAIAQRYAGRPAVIAYDLANEPWGDYQSDNDADLKRLMGRLHDAVRAVDPETLILMAGSLRGIGFYGDPRTNGWKHVGYTEHFYPGMFGFGEPTLEWHARFIGEHLTAKRAEIERLDVPYLIGEFNVVFDTCAQPALMRRYFDLYADNGWLATMWSLRILSRNGPHDNNWYLATNAEPFTLPDLRTASDGEIADAFARLGTLPYAIDEPLRAALTAPQPPELIMTRLTMPVDPPTSGLAGWRESAVGENARGGVKPDGASATVYGCGEDIWGERDSFYFVHQPAGEDLDRRIVLEGFEAPHHFAKAGLMLRADAAAGAPHVFVHVHPDGRVIAAWREQPSGPTQQRFLGVSGFPIGLGLTRGPAGLSAAYVAPDGAWRSTPLPPIAALQRGGVVGPAICSHLRGVFSAAQMQLGLDAEQVAKAVTDAGRSGPNLLKNSTFAPPAEGLERPPVAAEWPGWGNGLGVSPSADSSGLAFPARAGVERDAGIYQDAATVPAGAGVRARVWVERGSAEEAGLGNLLVRLGLESERDGQRLHIASRGWSAGQLAPGENLLQIEGTAPADGVRLVVHLQGGEPLPAEAALRFTRAELVVDAR